MQDIDKQEFQEAKISKNKYWIKCNLPNNIFFKECKLNHLPRIPNKGKTNHKFKDISINKFRDFKKLYYKYIVVR